MTIRIRLYALSAPILALGSLALAGCGSKEDKVVAEDASVEEVAEQVAKADMRPMPGRWEAKMTMEKIEIPGMPPELQGAMKEQLGKTQTSVSCLTKEQAEKQDGDFFKPANDSGCKYNKFAMGGGTIEADMTCQQEGMTQNMKMSGTYSDEAYAMKVSADGNMQGRPMSMAMAVEARRTGECDGKEES